MVLMHVVVLALTAGLSLAVIQLIFHAVEKGRGRPYSFEFVTGWALLYGVVGAQMSWVLRPFIGSYDVPYRPLRPLEGNFFEAVLALVGLR